MPQSKKDDAIIKAFMNERDLPSWFRGLSQFQLEAADSLLNSIRDDSEQGTAHRVREALIKLGIEPIVSRPKIKLAMRLSRGNDMAFLWFLMELYYRHACDQCEHPIVSGYSINEQLILSVISHLDTVTTLRELDRLLPKQPPQPVKPKVKEKRKPKPTYLLPYFEKQKRPISYGKSLVLGEVDNVANFGEYDKYLNPNFVVPNESTRWYANYKFSQSERIAKQIIKDQIDEIFEMEDTGTLDDVNKNTLMCAHHETWAAINETNANELEVTRKEACEKYFDVDGHLKDQSYKRVIKQVDQEIAKAKAYYQKLAANSLHMAQLPLCANTARQAEQNQGRRSSIQSGTTPNGVDGNKYDYGHGTGVSNGTEFFEAPTYHTPYKFNYEKIFDLGQRNFVKDTVANALKPGNSIGNMSMENSRAVRKCCKDIWLTEVQKFREECAAIEKEKKIQARAEREKGLLFPELPYYDPRDKNLMDSMLHRAIQEMRKNKKFVLASLPEAHKTPILKEWTKKRYGMVYTRKEKRSAFMLSKKVFHVLKKEENPTKIPELYNLSDERYVSYGCKKYLLRKTNYLKRKYHHNFNVNLLEDTRIHWGAVRPFQCSKGPPVSEFFSYLPARENDVQMFRPWKVSEFIPAKQGWDKRQKIKRLALLY